MAIGALVPAGQSARTILGACEPSVKFAVTPKEIQSATMHANATTSTLRDLLLEGTSVIRLSQSLPYRIRQWPFVAIARGRHTVIQTIGIVAVGRS